MDSAAMLLHMINLLVIPESIALRKKDWVSSMPMQTLILSLQPFAVLLSAVQCSQCVFWALGVQPDAAAGELTQTTQCSACYRPLLLPIHHNT